MNGEERTHLLVEEGPDLGLALRVPPEGARIGRSSSNDIVLSDEALSRFHCRFFFSGEGDLWIADLGSTNETEVNGVAVQEQALREGDRIAIGGSVLRVLSARREGAAPALPDLGLAPPPASSRPRARPLRFWLMLAAAALAAAIAVPIAGVTLWRLWEEWSRPTAPAGESLSREVAMVYEKVQADQDTIFRYFLTLEDGRLAVRIDNLADERHVNREQGADPDLVARLAADIERAGFFEMPAEFLGLARDVWDEWDLSVTVGRRHHRVRVLNRVEPPEFRKVREMIEEFIRNELGLAALALPPERLLALARDAYLQGRKLYDQRDVRHENLAGAIAAFQESIWYLETLEPKPDFHPAAVAALEECRRELETRYQEALFRSERAVKLRSWSEAAHFLRIICAMIPDRNDERHRQAWNRLLDVERRMERR